MNQQKQLSDEEKLKVMEATIQTVFDLLSQRFLNQHEILQALESAHMDNIPDTVKQMREVEAGKIRAIMSEQKDLITILKAMFPDVRSATTETKATGKRH